MWILLGGGGSGSMLPYEILKVWALRNAIACILSHFPCFVYGIFICHFLTIISKKQEPQRECFPFFGFSYKICLIDCRCCHSIIKFYPPHVSHKWKFTLPPPKKGGGLVLKLYPSSLQNHRPLVGRNKRSVPQLTGFSFVETFLLKFLIKYRRNLFSIYTCNSLNFWATLKTEELHLKLIIEPKEFDTDWVNTRYIR